MKRKGMYTTKHILSFFSTTHRRIMNYTDRHVSVPESKVYLYSNTSYSTAIIQIGESYA